MKKLAILGLIFIAGSYTVPVLAQCPMCKTALNSNLEKGGKRKVGLGINKGILFLLAMPYFLVGTAGLVWYKNARNKKTNS